jgi:hypothetical protein
VEPALSAVLLAALEIGFRGSRRQAATMPDVQDVISVVNAAIFAQLGLL